jgi:ketosteroid isomerase-like protein
MHSPTYKEAAMTAERPEQVIELLTVSLNRGDVDAAITLYESEAVFAPQPGEEVIRDALQQFAALKPRLRGEITNVLTAGDVAVVHNRWQLEGTQPDGSPVEMHGHSADVLRRASDGGWRILIDDPWGGG